VVQPISTLLHFKKGRLKFEPNVTLSVQELTGLSLPTGLWRLLVPIKLTKINTPNFPTPKPNLAFSTFPEGYLYSNQSNTQLTPRKFCTIK
jgi:hypothetical protein